MSISTLSGADTDGAVNKHSLPKALADSRSWLGQKMRFGLLLDLSLDFDHVLESRGYRPSPQMLHLRDNTQATTQMEESKAKSTRATPNSVLILLSLRPTLIPNGKEKGRNSISPIQNWALGRAGVTS